MSFAEILDLSVIVVVLGGERHLQRCLEALQRQRVGPAGEVIVPHDDALQGVHLFRERFPEMRFQHVPGRHSYAVLRAAGIRAARGRIVAVTEDQCIPPECWCANVLQAHVRPFVAIGGPVEKQQPDTPLNWALYLRELGTYMPPVNEGPTECLTDCNVTYKRAALEAIADVWTGAFHEPQVHAALRERGETLWISPALLTFQQRSLALRPALKERYEFGRLFGSLRASAVPGGKRLLYVAASPLLPAVFLVQVASRMLRKRRHWRACLAASPYLFLFSVAWSWGEFMGYLTGRPAASE